MAIEHGHRSGADQVPGWPLTPWIDIASAEIGVHELSPGDSARIMEYLSTVDTSAIGQLTDEVSWCSAFVNWVMRQSGYAGTDSAAARSWLAWGTPISGPRVGAIAVLKRGTQSWQGHVGFVTDYDSSYIYILGGNQRNEVNVSIYQRSRVIGYRWPREQASETNSRVGRMIPIIPPPDPERRWWQFWR